MYFLTIFVAIVTIRNLIFIKIYEENNSYHISQSMSSDIIFGKLWYIHSGIISTKFCAILALTVRVIKRFVFVDIYHVGNYSLKITKNQQ